MREGRKKRRGKEGRKRGACHTIPPRGAAATAAAVADFPRFPSKRFRSRTGDWRGRKRRVGESRSASTPARAVDIAAVSAAGGWRTKEGVTPFSAFSSLTFDRRG